MAKAGAPTQHPVGQGQDGRPTKYTYALCGVVLKLAKIGATERQMAEFLEVDVTTLWRWKARHPEFCNAMSEGKKLADEQVERALFQRAIGYMRRVPRVVMEGGKRRVVHLAEQMPPDVPAALFWLRNRRPERWHDRREQRPQVKIVFGPFIEQALKGS